MYLLLNSIKVSEYLWVVAYSSKSWNFETSRRITFCNFCFQGSHFAIFLSSNHILRVLFRIERENVPSRSILREFLFRHLHFPVGFIRRRLSGCIRARSTKIHKSQPACSSIKNASVSSAWSVDRRRVTNDFNDLRTHGNTTLIYE